MSNQYLTTPAMLELMNDLIRDQNITEFHRISKQDKAELRAQIYIADDTWSVESIIENEHWNSIKTHIFYVLRNTDGALDKNLGDLLRDVLPDYFNDRLEEIFEEQVSNWKCDVRHAAEQGE